MRPRFNLTAGDSRYWQGTYPAIFCIYPTTIMKELSIFIDESGDFGAYEPHSPYYIISLVIHDQQINISEKIHNFEEHKKLTAHTDYVIHTAPLIRKEEIYKTDTIAIRRKIFKTLFYFVHGLNVHYDHILIDKKDCQNTLQVSAKISRALSETLTNKQKYFSNFDKIKVYYDNGQNELTRILNNIFSAVIRQEIEFRKVKPKDYILFQVADMICTLELVAKKFADNKTSKSEKEFFSNKHQFRKVYYKAICKKRL